CQHFDTMFMSSELVAAMDSAYLLCDRLQHERPVYSGISTAKQHDMLVLVLVHVFHMIMKIDAFELVTFPDIKTTRLKCSIASCDNNCFCIMNFFIGS